MADGRRPENSLLGISLQQFTSQHKICHDDLHWPSELDRQLKFRTFKNENVRGRHIKKSKNGHTCASVRPIGMKLGTVTDIGHPSPNGTKFATVMLIGHSILVKMSNFKNPRWRMATI